MMNTISKIITPCLLLLWAVSLFSCKDERVQGEIEEGGLARVNVIDAVVTGGNAKVNVSAKKMNWSSIANNQVMGGQVLGGFYLSRLFMVPANRSTVLQAVPVSDTTKMWYDKVSQLSAGKMYTLYLSGTPTDVKTLFHEETGFPKYVIRDVAKPTPAADSTVNIRFVNLSPSGPMVDIKIQGGANVTSNLGYQQFTDFKTYSATSDHEYYTFEIRKSSDQTLVATYDFPAYYFLFKSVAVVMMGIYPGVGLPYADKYKIEGIAYE